MSEQMQWGWLLYAGCIGGLFVTALLKWILWKIMESGQRFNGNVDEYTPKVVYRRMK